MIGVWPPLPPAGLRTCVGRDRSAEVRPYPLDEPDCRLFSRARHGLRSGLADLGVGAGDVVLMPAWHHGSEVEAVLGAGAGCRFYDLGPDLQLDPAQLESLLGPTVRALHLTHYLGFAQDAGRWRRWCDERGLLLVEDAAQAWLTRRSGVPVGSHGDLAVWCLYKTFGLPDGAAVRGPVRAPAGYASAGSAVLRRHVAWWAQALPPAPVRSPGVYDPVRDFATGDARGASRATHRLLSRVDDGRAVMGRRRQYAAYLDVVGDLAPGPFADLVAGVVPFAYPVAVPDKPAAIEAFGRQGVRALDLWSVAHPAMPAGAHPRAAWLRRHLVGLPVHQELSSGQARRLVRTAVRVLGGMRAPRWPG